MHPREGQHYYMSYLILFIWNKKTNEYNRYIIMQRNDSELVAMLGMP